VALAALRFQGTAATPRCLRLIQTDALLLLARDAAQDGALRTNILVGARVIAEGLFANLRYQRCVVSQGHIGPYPSIFYGFDDVHRAVGRVSRDTPRSQLPAKAGSPEQVEKDRVFNHVRGRDQDPEDEPGRSAIYYIVAAIAQLHTLAMLAHQCGIGVGRADPEVRVSSDAYSHGITKERTRNDEECKELIDGIACESGA
jgi:hypothetical protein